MYELQGIKDLFGYNEIWQQYRNTIQQNTHNILKDYDSSNILQRINTLLQLPKKESPMVAIATLIYFIEQMIQIIQRQEKSNPKQANQNKNTLAHVVLHLSDLINSQTPYDKTAPEYMVKNLLHGLQAILTNKHTPPNKLYEASEASDRLLFTHVIDYFLESSDVEDSKNTDILFFLNKYIKVNKDLVGILNLCNCPENTSSRVLSFLEPTTEPQRNSRTNANLLWNKTKQDLCLPVIEHILKLDQPQQFLRLLNIPKIILLYFNCPPQHKSSLTKILQEYLLKDQENSQHLKKYLYLFTLWDNPDALKIIDTKLGKEAYILHKNLFYEYLKKLSSYSSSRIFANQESKRLYLEQEQELYRNILKHLEELLKSLQRVESSDPSFGEIQRIKTQITQLIGETKHTLKELQPATGAKNSEPRGSQPGITNPTLAGSSNNAQQKTPSRPGAPAGRNFATIFNIPSILPQGQSIRTLADAHRKAIASNPDKVSAKGNPVDILGPREQGPKPTDNQPNIADSFHHKARASDLEEASAKGLPVDILGPREQEPKAPNPTDLHAKATLTDSSQQTANAQSRKETTEVDRTTSFDSLDILDSLDMMHQQGRPYDLPQDEISTHTTKETGGNNKQRDKGDKKATLKQNNKTRLTRLSNLLSLKEKTPEKSTSDHDDAFAEKKHTNKETKQSLREKIEQAIRKRLAPKSLDTSFSFDPVIQRDTASHPSTPQHPQSTKTKQPSTVKPFTNQGASLMQEKNAPGETTPQHPQNTKTKQPSAVKPFTNQGTSLMQEKNAPSEPSTPTRQKKKPQ